MTVSKSQGQFSGEPKASDPGVETWQVLGVEREEQVSYLARLAGVVEGVDVLGAEVHYPAVDVIEICAPGGVAWGAAQRCGLRGGLRWATRRHSPQ